MKKYILAQILIVMLFAFNNNNPRAAEILYTGCMHGQLENCHCPEDPLGSMEKQAAEIISRRNINPDLLLMCSGDFMPATVDTISAPFVLEALKYTSYDVVTIGDQELLQGEKNFRKILKSLNVVSANLINKKGKLLAKPFKKFKRDGVTYFVTGITHPMALKFVDPTLIPEDVDLLDINEALRATLAKAPKDAFIILLSHSGFEIDKLIAEDFPQIDLIIAGHSQTRLDSQLKVGKVTIVQAGGSGRYIGIAHHKSGNITSELIPMEPSMPDDDFIIEQVMKLKSARKRNR